jgi:hypothetical protein
MATNGRRICGSFACTNIRIAASRKEIPSHQYAAYKVTAHFEVTISGFSIGVGTESYYVILVQ